MQKIVYNSICKVRKERTESIKPADNLNHILQQNINNKDLKGMKDMRIKYFGENKENGTGRVAVIRFTDNEYDLYEYIAKYENTYGDSDREFFNGAIIGIERDENGVWINEAWINVDDFTDFNDFKANYKEAKKEFKSLKKQATEKTETTTKPETADQGETAESDTKQYECENVVQVAHKVADLTKTRLDRQVWKEYCDEVKKDGSSWFDYTAFDTGGNEFDVSIFLGYDQQCRHYFVSVDYEKCHVPDMLGGA